jgi:mono/diheme cytochrome c family protein
MNFFNRRIYISAISLMFLLVLSEYPVMAADCVQKRKTPKAPSNIYKQTNPLEHTPENITAGKSLYQKGAKPLACFQCHGTNGGGNGKMANGMQPEPRDFSCKAMMKTIPDGQLFWVVKNGSKGTGMMGFKNLKDNQIWQVISYIRQFSN